jgi:hypothetical protein
MRKTCPLRILNDLAIVLLGALIFLGAGPVLDQQFPVVKPYEITVAKLENNHLFLSGWATKRRDCLTIEVQALVTKSNGYKIYAPIEFLDSPNGNFQQRPMGIQEWGPWEVSLPPEATRLEVSALYHCHIFLKDLVNE